MFKAIQLSPSNYLKTYYQILDVVTWLLRQEKLNKKQMKFLKNANSIKKLLIVEKLNCWKQNH